ncbi:S41 family peptidase [Treponema putidum]|uniref:S41 family peptidase n=1 Tax=Treponema putidum TaxID=221027 RepID=UPI00210241BA|nr:S41 family peptidase [Treponema putidum]
MIIKKLIFRTVVFILVFVFVIIALIISKKNDVIYGFISAEEMRADYEYFWDFIYTGCPFTEVCERKRIDLEQIRQAGYRYLSDPMMQYGYYFFYKDLCRKITGNRYIGHLYPFDYFDYYFNYKKIENTAQSLSIKKQALIDNFYSHIYQAETLSYQNIGNFSNKNSSSIGIRKYSKPFIQIIETDHIAYIEIKSFLTTEEEEKQEYLKVLENFFIETANYKHIIIDIRNNGGGYTENYEAILSFNITKDMNIISYGLYNENKYTDIYLDMFFKNYKSKNINRYEVPNIKNCGTVKNDKAYRLEETVVPRPVSGYKPCERKKFWLLVDSGVYSEADRFAYVCKKSGFATVVGSNTGGAGTNGKSPMYIVLPNSGLLIKFDFMYGLTEDGYCTDEFGTAPDIYNFPGKSALGTCLEEIKRLRKKTD